MKIKKSKIDLNFIILKLSVIKKLICELSSVGKAMRKIKLPD